MYYIHPKREFREQWISNFTFLQNVVLVNRKHSNNEVREDWNLWNNHHFELQPFRLAKTSSAWDKAQIIGLTTEKNTFLQFIWSYDPYNWILCSIMFSKCNLMSQDTIGLLFWHFRHFLHRNLSSEVRGSHFLLFWLLEYLKGKLQKIWFFMIFPNYF